MQSKNLRSLLTFCSQDIQTSNSAERLPDTGRKIFQQQ